MVLNDHSRPDLERALRDAGLKLTPQRLAIIRCLEGDRTHPTAQQIRLRLEKSFPTTSVTTVYNTLSALTQIGQLRQLDMGGPIRFDPNSTAHDHAVCEHCGSIRDVEISRARGGQRGQERKARGLGDFEVSRIERVYRGVCSSCRSTASSHKQK